MTRTPCFGRFRFALAALCICLPAVVAAQGADLDAEAQRAKSKALLEESEDSDFEGDEGAKLLDRGSPEDVEVKDPDPKLLQEVAETRREMERIANNLGPKVDGFDKLQKKYDKLMSRMLEVVDTYLEKNNQLMTNLRVAASGPPVKQKQVAASIVKLRKKFVSDVRKLSKSASKLSAEADKLLQKYKAQEEEDEE